MADITLPGAGGAETITGTGDPTLDGQIQNSFQNAPGNIVTVGGGAFVPPGTPSTVIFTAPPPPAPAKVTSTIARLASLVAPHLHQPSFVRCRMSAGYA